MAAAIRGRLISSAFAVNILPSLPLFTPPPDRVRSAFEHYAERIDGGLGPASGIRAITDLAVAPLLKQLDLAITAREDEPTLCRLHTAYGGTTGPLLLVTAWGESLERTWRTAVHGAIANDARWCLCCNGVDLRVVDARHTWSRDYLELDLGCLKERSGQDLVWSLLRGEAMARQPTILEDVLASSARHGTEVCQALGRGVLEALGLLLSGLRRRRRAADEVLFEHCLTVLYRILFLLFAEARGLVPLWHPVYRDRYSLESIVSTLLTGRPYRGLCHAIQAISRLAHAGCSAGELRVTAFNGRLFAPAQTEAFDRTPISDDVMRNAMVAVSSVTDAGTRTRNRIAFRDLDVEQLGAVYEQVLDYEPSPDESAPLIRTRDIRKSSGAFYTPRALTAFLVRRTLTPIVVGKTAEEILRLRVVDPAMGSGAFLVAACRFLAGAAEDALVAEGRWHPGDVTPAERALLRRDIASRCLYGVDLNPMAVQLARLSLWLATLAADKPLSFLDHHLVTGDSLVGATPADVQRQPGGRPARQGRLQPLSLFHGFGLNESLADAARVRTRLAVEPDDSAAVVRQKERTLASLCQSDTAINHWRRVLDLWCAGWFWDSGPAPDRGTFGDLVSLLLRGHSTLPDRVARQLVDHAAERSRALRFLHWSMTFPEVFADGGFDAVIGNPPWDMVRGDTGAADARVERQQRARHTTRFLRESGVYTVTSQAHANRYQLFVERTLHLLRPGGRFGLVLPSGAFTDIGSAALRRHLFDRAAVDAVTGLDNRGGIFPIHRSVRFALVTATAGQRTHRIRCRFGLTTVTELESAGEDLDLSRDLLARLSGSDDLAVPELSSARDLRIVEAISTRIPCLRHPSGWHVHFGRELNATDDRDAFRRRTGDRDARPVVEGKQLDPFCVHVDRSQMEMRPGVPVGRRIPRRTRLAYREVASSTNRLTLIAALLPAAVVSTHTVFCLKTLLPLSHQRVLCALLNSFVANYLIRLRVNTHVTAALIARLPVPVVEPAHPAFDRLLDLSNALSRCANVEHAPEYAELQAVTARLYELSADDFGHVLTTFPLMPESVRLDSHRRFTQSRT